MKKNISKKILQEFGIILGFTFPIIIGWALPSLLGHSFRTWTLLISVPSLILAKANPDLLFYPYKVWMKLGKILGWLNSYLILGLVFIFVLLPIALIMRIFGHDPLKIKKSNKKSYREVRLTDKINLRQTF